MPIPLILASRSKPRRDMLYPAGICPTIHVSHVDEPAVLEATVREEDVIVDDSSTRQRVMTLTAIKTEAVYRAYRDVASTAAAATDSHVIAYPPRVKEIKDSECEAAAEDLRETTAGKPIDYFKTEITTTRDFSGINMPAVAGPTATAIAGQPGLAEAIAGPLILSRDPMFPLSGKCYGKLYNEAVARERLRRMSGVTGEPWASRCLIGFTTGRTVYGVGHARVHFGEFTGADVERYIVTGEPLGVIGSSTLESSGGAFTDSIGGDPYGITGLNLPLTRHLASELGITWTDLWDVGRGELELENKTLGSQRAGILPSVENVHQFGDDRMDCACGRKHWGTNGVSGVLLARRNPASSKVAHAVIQHRTAWSVEGGTWDIPGGATAGGKSSIEGALRGGYEETNITPEDIEVIGSYREDHGLWAYAIVFTFEKPGHTVEPKVDDDESMEICWVPTDDVPNRKPLTAMKTD